MVQEIAYKASVVSMVRSSYIRRLQGKEILHADQALW